jgi:hypothetical protein
VAVVRSALLIAAAAGLVAAAPAVAQTPPPAAPVTGNVIFDGSWDRKAQPRRGFLPAQWLGLQTQPRRTICFTLKCARYSLKVVKTPVRDGAAAGRFDVRDGDSPFKDRTERAEVQGKVTGAPGTSRWYVWSTYLPPNFRHGPANDDRWLAFTQWAVSRGSAPVAMTVHLGHIALQINEQASPTRFLAVHRPWGSPIAGHLGRWTDFALFVRWSAGGDGQIQLWVDGVQQPMNWPFGGDDPAPFGGIGSYAYTGRTLVPRGGATFIRQGIVRARAYSGRTVLVHDALKVHAATTAPVPPPPVPPVPPAPAPPA